MTATRVQRVTSNATDVTSLSVTGISAPTSGNLLTIYHYASSGDQTASMTAPTGWTKVTGATTTTTASGSCTWYWRVSDGTEGGTVSVVNAASTGIFVGAIFEEWSAGAAFAASPVDASGFSNGASGITTITVTASGATTQANTLALAGIGVGGTAGGFNNSWTNSFAQDTTLVNRMELAAKQPTATETLSTTETWTTARAARASIVAFKVPAAAPAVPTGLAATPISSSQINLSWNAVTGATSYGVYRDGVALTLTNPTTSFSDTGLAAGTTHAYEVDAAN